MHLIHWRLVRAPEHRGINCGLTKSWHRQLVVERNRDMQLMENHLWILDVLEDLKTYSSRNKLQTVGVMVGVMLDVVRQDLIQHVTPTSAEVPREDVIFGNPCEDVADGEETSTARSLFLIR
jgi:hypothetical protein